MSDTWRERVWRVVAKVGVGRMALRLYGRVRKAVRNASSPFMRRYPAGHFYSPVPDRGAVERAREAGDRLRSPEPGAEALAGIELRLDAQLDVLEEVARMVRRSPGGAVRPDGRYSAPNNYFGRTDAEVLYGLLQLHRPRRLLEIGGGFSTALMLDVADELDGDLRIRCVEPHPERLHERMRRGDEERLAVDARPVQEIGLEPFRALEADDVLFVDSSHVVKNGSDVLHLLTEVLPALRPGVLVHVHDVFWPFEYPPDWFRRGIAWNEAYFLRTFLEFNTAFRIHLWPSALLACRPERSRELLDLSPEAGSFWMRKVS